MFAGLVALLCAANGLNVANSYVGRNFMTAITNRNTAEFVRQALFYVGVFAALTVVAVFARFAEERLALLWREFLTRRAVGLYLAGGTFYRLDASGELANPDQRIADDVRSFTASALSFVLMALNSSFTVVAFSGVLWSISPLLFLVAVLYAACGSFVTFVLGRPLIKLNSNQLDKEASFRSSLIHVRENAESIMTTRREERQAARLLFRLDDLVANFRQITAINRNVGFFTTGYNWLIQIIPALIIAPAFIRGDVEFGVIIQSSIAFTLVAAFSLIVTQFQSLSTFAAVVARLSSLIEAFEQSQATQRAAVEIVETPEGRLAYEGLTLLSGTDHEPLLKDLSISVPPGRRVLLTGSNLAAGTAVFRATAGASVAGTGRIIRPGADGVLFLPERPYLPPGTLRQLLVRAPASDVPDERILVLLHDLDLEHVVTHAGGLDAEQDWGNRLSLQEQQALAVAHVLLETPQFVLLNQIGAELSLEQIRRILRVLSERSIARVNIGQTDSRDLYDAVLEYGTDGSWTWTTARG